MTGSTDLSLESLRGKQLRMARRRATAITLFRSVLANPVGEAMLSLLDCLDHRPVADAGTPAPRGSLVARAYAEVFALLATEGAPAVESADAWQSHLLWRVVDDQNPFSLAAAGGGMTAVAPSVLDQARRDLRGLQWLYSLSADAIREATGALVGEELIDALASWQAVSPPANGADSRTAIARRLSVALDWGALAEDLAAHWSAHGLGLFARALAARWSARDGGDLQGIDHPDPIRLEELIAYDSEREPLLRNTERFITGLPAHHVLLYGERGTGKSSTVKALVHAYGERGLRLVELARDDLGDLSRVLGTLRQLPQRFVLFVDDLSFEEHEVQYKALKAALEGTVEAWPHNVVLYVTTNRRHLIKERFSDRDHEQNGEVRPRDTMEEKLSLADRFGLLVTFPAPDQERYVRVALGLAHAHQIGLADDELRRRAIQWALWHNGRSCRTARQFVDELIAEQQAIPQ
ncbi:MAG TPA: ATP-binding protein [Chloroflexota bacterium]|nr:ATP-binding protein [Chloroflexota bacterium]